MISVARPLEALARPVQVGCALLLLGCALAALVDPHNSSFVYRQPLVWVATGLCLLGWFALLHLRAPERLSGRRIEVLSACVLSAIAGVISWQSQYRYLWDARVAMTTAGHLANHTPLARGELGYFGLYPNNMPLLGMDLTCARLAGAIGVPVANLVCVVNSLFLLGTMLCVCGAARRLGHGRAGLVLQLMMLLLLGLNPLMSVPYTDLPACFFVAVCVLSAVVWRTSYVPSTKVAAVVVFAVAAGLAASFKPYAFVLVLALVVTSIIFVARFLRRRGRRSIALVPLAVLLTAGAYEANQALARGYVGFSSHELHHVGSPMPPLHFVQMGLHDTHDPSPTRLWGGFDLRSVLRVTAQHSPSARQRVIEHDLQSELDEQGVGETSVFLLNKLAWIWGDGSFWGQGEGKDRVEGPLHPNPVAAFTLQRGQLFPYKAALAQGAWLSLLLVTGVQLFRRSVGVATVWMSLSVLGVTAYLLLFEGRPRYLVALLPALLVLTALSTPRPRYRGRHAAGGRKAGAHAASLDAPID